MFTAVIINIEVVEKVFTIRAKLDWFGDFTYENAAEFVIPTIAYIQILFLFETVPEVSRKCVLPVSQVKAEPYSSESAMLLVELNVIWKHW